MVPLCSTDSTSTSRSSATELADRALGGSGRVGQPRCARPCMLRKAPGGHPIQRRKAPVKWLWSLNPCAAATSPTGRSVSRNMSAARSSPPSEVRAHGTTERLTERAGEVRSAEPRAPGDVVEPGGPRERLFEESPRAPEPRRDRSITLLGVTSRGEQQQLFHVMLQGQGGRVVPGSPLDPQPPGEAAGHRAPDDRAGGQPVHLERDAIPPLQRCARPLSV